MSRRSTRTLSRALVTAAAVAAAAVMGVALSPSADRTVEAVGDELGSGGEYQGIDPARIYDSRETAPRLPMGPSETDAPIDIQVAGEGGLPPFEADANGFDANVLAVVVNITVIDPTHIGFLRAYGTGAAEGTTSVVNFFPNTVIPNTAIIAAGLL